jgi:asparagine synthase (glutamine-hydrolysing)
MCGITGWVNYSNYIDNKKYIVEKMTESLAKRGPDETNVWGSKNVFFGHKRLSVVDLVGGRQPMSKIKNNKTYTICYNGELYNTEEIRSELLKRGYTFKSHSDTEVLLTSYVEWQENCVDYLNGIFAFSIWDEENKKLFIARDRLGVKPLFYYEQNGTFLFGSELKSILAHDDVKTEIDREGLCELLGLGPSHTPGSGIYKGIKELRPGHSLTYSKDGLKIWRYWNVTSSKHTDNIEETKDKLSNLLSDAIVKQLVSDVPVCTFLSGGLDSSAITAIAANHFNKIGKGSLHTYSIDYEGNDKYFKVSEFQPNSDSYWIKLMSDKFNTTHHRCEINNEILFNYLEEAVDVRDLPGMADVDSSLLWFCREIKKDFVVGLSGECADEIFGGYPWFYRNEDLEREGFPWIRSLDARENLLQDKWKKTLNLKSYVIDKYNTTVSETPLLDGESEEEASRRKLFYINMIWFMTTLLERKDRMSMGASLEVRVPFADHRIVEYAWNIPWEMKSLNGREKGLLRDALRGILPEEIIDRKKSPYPKTHNPFYTDAVTEWLKKLTANKDSILHELFEKEKIAKLIETKGSDFSVPWFGQLMTGPQLLAHLGQLHYWAEKYRVNIVE